MIKIPKEIMKVAQIAAIILIIGMCIYISSTSIMSMGDFSGNGR